MAFAGLYGNLPSAKDEQGKGGEEAAAAGAAKKEAWVGSAAGFLPANLAAKRQQGAPQRGQRPQQRAG